MEACEDSHAALGTGDHVQGLSKPIGPFARLNETPFTKIATGFMNAQDLRYVLITPARNEEAFLENTILSVVAQTTTPLKWVIVSDGSTDRTDDIVKSYVRQHD